MKIGARRMRPLQPRCTNIAVPLKSQIERINGFAISYRFVRGAVMLSQPDRRDRGMNLAYEKSKMKGSLTLKQHLESGCPWRWIKQIQRRLNWRIIVAICHHACQTASMCETQNKKMVWLLFWRNNSRRLAWQGQRCRFTTSIFASRRWGRRIVVRSRTLLII